MKFIYSLLFALVVVALVNLAHAAGTTATVSFDPVTQYVDNSPLPATDVLKYTVKWSGGFQDAATPTACGSKLCVDVPVLCGNRTFTVTVTTKSTALYPNTTSGDSNSVAYASGVSCAPKAPTGVTAS